MPDRVSRMQQPLHNGVITALTSPIVQKLRHDVQLTSADEAILAGLSITTRRVERGDIQRKGIILIVEGWLYRYKQLEDGKRQITKLFISGDFCEAFGTVSGVIPPYDLGDKFTCRVRMIRRGPYLVVNDNNACGGANVSFSGFNRRKV